MSNISDVAIIGAGPYGLSIAAHLRELDVDFRIFGSPMHTWLNHMPRGMFLKSDGFASNLSDPGGQLTLDQFCREQRIPYGSSLYETGWKPVHVDTFNNYGLSFQKRFVPNVEVRTVVDVDHVSGRFFLRFQDGETVSARNVVIAIGIHGFENIPAEFSHLPPDYLSHSSKFGDLVGFSGRKVAVVGAGASAVELAALLHEVGAEVSLVTRRRAVDFQPVPIPRARWKRVLRPITGIGYGWHSFLLSEMPTLTHYLPLDIRTRLVQRYLHPCAGWFVRDRVIGKIPLVLACTQMSADIYNRKAHLRVVSGDDGEMEIAVDHIVAATGYRPDLGRLAFLSEKLQSSLRSPERAPALSASFQSRVPNLYFVGPLSSNSFGPPMRFVHGARYTAQRLAKYLAKSCSQMPRGADLPFNQVTKTLNSRAAD